MIDKLIAELESSREFFDRSTSSLEEAHSSFKPTDDMMSTASQVMHAALTVEWFIDGAFADSGFDMTFEDHQREVNACTSLKEARERFAAAFSRAIDTLRSKSVEEWSAPLPEGPVMGGAPRFAVIGGIVEHTAHHRGALSVYARLQGVEPPMPYM